MTAYLTPAGKTFDGTAEPTRSIGGLTVAAGAPPAYSNFQTISPGSTVLEQSVPSRGQAWPQGVPRKSGYVP